MHTTPTTRSRLGNMLVERGYLSVAELRAVPYLMCEAMIAEAVLPIAATGSFGRLDGFGFLVMVRKKVEWILENIKELWGVLED